MRASDGAHGHARGLGAVGWLARLARAARARSAVSQLAPLLLGAAAAGALTLVEPTATAPCDLNGGIYGCVVTVKGRAYWFRPDSICGGGLHAIPDLALADTRVLELPLPVDAACYGPGGWGPAWRGQLVIEPVEGR